MPLLVFRGGIEPPSTESESVTLSIRPSEQLYVYCTIYFLKRNNIFQKNAHTICISKGGVWMKKYANLNELLLDDMEANKYFATLPDYMKSQMNEWSHSIDSFETLKNCSEKLLRWDD